MRITLLKGKLVAARPWSAARRSGRSAMRKAGMSPERRRRCAGGALFGVLAVGAILAVTTASMLILSGATYRNSQGRSDWHVAFYHAENALQWAAQALADTPPSGGSNFFSTVDGTLNLPYLAVARTNAGGRFKNAWVSVVRTNSDLPNNYLVTASARVGDRVHTVQAVVIRSPASYVFDYEYFLNNWGWWRDGGITGNGGNRANWDFDFQGNPTVNGQVLANGQITQGGTPVDPFSPSLPFGGLARGDPIALVHAGIPRLSLPNLKDLSYYCALAQQTPGGSLWLGTNRLLAGVHTNSAQPGLCLVGTANQPILVSNIVVVPGDVVIKGVVGGHGTLYVGGNLYVAGDLVYRNPPDWTSAPETLPPGVRDKWVVDHADKDLVGFAVRGSILGGDVTSGDWKTACFDPAACGLSRRGDEAHLGADGIPFTPDDNLPWVDTNGDGAPDSCAFDADGDGVIRGLYDYSTELTMTVARAGRIAYYPTNTDGSLAAYNDLASNDMNRLDGIFYTNHALALRLARDNAVFHGTVVCRDEAIIYSGTCLFVYDSRIHSRYHQDPNRCVNLGLPVAGLLSLTSFSDLPPNWAGL